MKGYKIFDECQLNGEKFAILVNDEEMTAIEAVWDETEKAWNADFSYFALKINSFDVAEALDFDGCRTKGYKFEE